MKKYLKVIIIVQILCIINLSFIPHTLALCPKQSTEQGTLNKPVVTKMPQSENVLALLQGDLSSKKSQKGDVFCAQITKDIYYNGNLMIPEGSYLKGHVEQVKKTGYINRSEYIVVSVDTIQHKDNCLTLQEKIKFKFQDPNRESLVGLIFGKLPFYVATAATSIALYTATNMSSVARWGISIGAGALAGILIAFEESKHTCSCKNLYQCLQSAYNATSIGTIHATVFPGNGFKISKGEYVEMDFNESILYSLEQQHNKQLISSY